MEGCTALLTSAPPMVLSCPSRPGCELRSLGKGLCISSAGGRKVRRLYISSNYDSGFGRSENAMGGDSKVQQMLVEMVQIQMGKARVNNFVDERSEYMRSIADEAQRDYNLIALRTMKGLDATGSRVLRQLDLDAYAIQRELKNARAELEVQLKEFEEYERRSKYSRNEGLFFKNLYAAPLPVQSRSSLYKPKYTEKVRVLATPSPDVSTSYRQILYAGLSLVIVSFMWSCSSAVVAGTMMRPSKLAAYGVILSLLITQLAYVKRLTGELEPDTSSTLTDGVSKEISSTDGSDSSSNTQN